MHVKPSYRMVIIMPEARKRSYRHPKYKTAYRVKNWAEYENQDPSQVPDLLDQFDKEIDRFVGDGIYDQDPVYEAVERHSPGATLVVPPRVVCCPTIRSHLRPNEIVISQRSRAKVVSSGNANRGTICRVTRRTRCFVTRRFSEGV